MAAQGHLRSCITGSLESQQGIQDAASVVGFGFISKQRQQFQPSPEPCTNEWRRLQRTQRMQRKALTYFSDATDAGEVVPVGLLGVR